MKLLFHGFSSDRQVYSSSEIIEWRAGDVREVEEELGAMLLADFATCGEGGKPAFALVGPPKPKAKPKPKSAAKSKPVSKPKAKSKPRTRSG